MEISQRIRRRDTTRAKYFPDSIIGRRFLAASA